MNLGCSYLLFLSIAEAPNRVEDICLGLHFTKAMQKSIIAVHDGKL